MLKKNQTKKQKNPNNPYVERESTYQINSRNYKNKRETQTHV